MTTLLVVKNIPIMTYALERQKKRKKSNKMDNLVCDYCGKDITEGDYIVTKYGEVYCDGDELLDVLEQEGYFIWHLIEEQE